MTRIEEQLWRQEQSFLYSAGCQMESEFDLAYECDCGHTCETGEEHKVEGETLCPECYARRLAELHEKYLEVMKSKFTEEELDIMYDEGILEDFTDGVLHRTVSA